MEDAFWYAVRLKRRKRYMVVDIGEFFSFSS